jgi:hypothetical protein
MQQQYLYLITPTGPLPDQYDVFLSAIVVAPTAEAAAATHPDNLTPSPWPFDAFSSWVASPADVTVLRVGIAEPGLQPGVLLARFNAG